MKAVPPLGSSVAVDGDHDRAGEGMEAEVETGHRGGDVGVHAEGIGVERVHGEHVTVRRVPGRRGGAAEVLRTVVVAHAESARRQPRLVPADSAGGQFGHRSGHVKQDHVPEPGSGRRVGVITGHREALGLGGEAGRRAVAVGPGPAAGSRPGACTGRGGPGGSGGGSDGTGRWAQLLPGPWVGQAGLLGTTPAHGQAYAALGDQVAAVGSGLALSAYAAGSGQPLWTADLTGFPAGSAIVSVRVLPGVVSAGVRRPAAAGTATRQEVVLAAATGRRIRAYPAAPFGGAVAADAAATVIVGPHAVTRYANRTGAVLWTRPTGQAAQAWQ